MQIFDNINATVKDDLLITIGECSRISIAAACFSLYTYQALKKQLNGIKEPRFIFTSPAFIAEKAPREKREFYIPRLNRERSLYNTMALNNCELFAFGCGAGGHSGGYSYMLHRVLSMYESMVDQGIKPIMGMFRQAKAAPVTEKIQAQMNQCRLDLAGLAGTDAALKELHWLGKLWEEYGLWKYNGHIYQLTEAGEFWNMNMTQTLVESAELLWKK